MVCRFAGLRVCICAVRHHQIDLLPSDRIGQECDDGAVAGLLLVVFEALSAGAFRADCRCSTVVIGGLLRVSLRGADILSHRTRDRGKSEHPTEQARIKDDQTVLVHLNLTGRSSPPWDSKR